MGIGYVRDKLNYLFSDNLLEQNNVVLIHDINNFTEITTLVTHLSVMFVTDFYQVK